MGDEPANPISAGEWRELRTALVARMRRLIESRNEAATTAEADQLQAKIDALKQQVGALAVEQAVAQFVEDAERYMLAANTLSEELNRDPDEAG